MSMEAQPVPSDRTIMTYETKPSRRQQILKSFDRDRSGITRRPDVRIAAPHLKIHRSSLGARRPIIAGADILVISGDGAIA